MTQQPINSDPNLPGAGQAAPTQGVPQPAPGTQAPDTLIGGPMPQPPADPKKKNTGLLVGGLIAIGIAIAIIAGFVLASIFGGSSDVSSYQKFQKAVQSASEKVGAGYCMDENNVAASLSEDLSDSKEFFATELGENPIDFNFYYCSNIDMSDEDAIDVAGSDDLMIVGVYSNDVALREHRILNLMQESGPTQWAAYGENWLVIGSGLESFDAQSVIVKKLNGEAVNP